MNLTSIALFGNGGFAKVVANLIEDINTVTPWFQLECVVDESNEPSERSDSLPLYKSIEEALEFNSALKFVVAVGDPVNRHRILNLVEQAGSAVVTVVHPSAIFAPSVRIGAGCVVMPNVVVEPDVLINSNCILNKSVTIGHDSRLADSVVVHSNSSVAGDCSIGSQTLIGQCVSVRQGCSIGEACQIGAGASVIGDIPSLHVALGVPAVARALKS